MDIIFFDKNPEIMVAYKKILGSSHTYICTDVNNIVDHSKHIDYIVSPANSHGLMDGGIDLVYCKMFPGIQKVVRELLIPLSHQ